MEYVTLNNGLKMPQLGFGVWQIEDDKVSGVLKKAFNMGFRSIDTAAVYENERGVGEGIALSDVPRDKMFVTTKLRNRDQGYDSTLKAFESSLEKLGLNYVDLYLIHWPMPKIDKYIESYKALEKLYKDGFLKSIGVCNFSIKHLERLLSECEIIPTVNQVECHPYLQQKELKRFCKEHNIYLEAWSPLMQGGEVLRDKTIKEIATNYNKTPAQVVIRWHIQSSSIVIPKSVTESRIEENFNVFDFELNDYDMDKIAGLDKNQRKGPIPDDMNILE